ncbi:MAG: hypothetical protein AAF581_17135, partial [Planctomycetota bacterium]
MRQQTTTAWLWVGVLCLCTGFAGAQQPCDPGIGTPGGTGPDVIVGEFPDINSYGTANGYAGYAVGTTSCNIGTQQLQWIAGNTNHPVIGQNLYRLKDGRFEHIGMSWLKHGFTALQQNACGCGCAPSGTGTMLGLGCSDPYVASLNGNQGDLGARSEVTNPAQGLFLYPQVLDPPNQDLTWRRLRVAVSDVDPAQNAGALYFVEGHYVTPDDAAAGNAHNNASHRQVSIGSGGNFPMSFSGATQRTRPAIFAWADNDPNATVLGFNTSDGGRVFVGYSVTDNLDGTFHYEYAVMNLNSTRAIGSFALPLPTGITVQNEGFHDCDYHSGEVIDGTDWAAQNTLGTLQWETAQPHSANPNGNAIRWSSMYNFRFDANSMPVPGSATLGYFQAGTPADFTATVLVPSADFTLPVTGLTCTPTDQDVVLAWTNGEAYDSIEVTRDGVTLATLAGTDTTYTDVAAGTGVYQYRINAVAAGVPSGGIPCDAEILPPLAFEYPNGFGELLNPFGDTLAVQIVEQSGGALSGAPRLFYDDGSGFTQLALNPVGNEYFATFPPIACGTEVHLYLEADDLTTGVTVTDPEGAPSTFFVLTSATNLTDDFYDMETDNGWTVGFPGDNATTGIWDRGDPEGTTAQPEDDHSPDPGTQCWVTGAAAGGSAGANDVDGGRTTLLSPVFDTSMMIDPTISYWRWYSNGAGQAPNSDTFRVQISTNGLAWLPVEVVGPAGPEVNGGWFFNEFRVADIVALTGTVQVRFIAEDVAPGGLIEAAIDDFLLFDFECDDDCNGNGVGDDSDILAGTSSDCDGNGIPDECDITAGASDVDGNGVLDSCEGAEFVRGDCNNDGSTDLSDAIFHLSALFNAGDAPTCERACDNDDDGATNIGDPIVLL